MKIHRESWSFFHCISLCRSTILSRFPSRRSRSDANVSNAVTAHASSKLIQLVCGIFNMVLAKPLRTIASMVEARYCAYTG